MARTPLILLLLPLTVMLFVVAAPPARAVFNPHIEPASCPSCHTKVPTAEQVQAGDFFLIKDSIDDTCHICHEYSCCKPGSLHAKNRNHPSNINTWDRKLFRAPKTLPLHDGYITCNTCHFHRADAGAGFKLVRIVKIDGKKIDWTDLCVDCHVGY